MKICLVHNAYGVFSGEESVVQNQLALLATEGHPTCTFFRQSSDIQSMFLGPLRAFFCGIYNPSSKKSFRSFLQSERPDIIHVHNLFPLLSPSILDVCREMRIPTVMTVHNYRLLCPNGLFAVRGEICERCAGGREFWCIIRNCENNYGKSLGYALRNFVARVRKSYVGNIDCFLVLTEFQRQKLLQAGFPREKLSIVPNMSDFQPEESNDAGEYIGYVGRVSPEKGIDTLVSAACICSGIPFSIAGAINKNYPVRRIPDNVTIRGHLDRAQIRVFFALSRIVVLCSLWYEGLPMALVEAMISRKPVLAPRIGGIPEIVEDGVTGLLYTPGNSTELAEKINFLWQHPDICHHMGEAGQRKARREYSSTTYYQRLMQAYEKAIESCHR